MNNVGTWILVVIVAVLVVGLLRYARGPEHHHGDDVGAWSQQVSRTDPV